MQCLTLRKAGMLMAKFFEYLDNEIFCHHSLDAEPSPEKFYLHVHERLEIFYLIQGNMNYIVEGNIYPMRPGDVIITDRGEAHKVELYKGQPYERISIQFDMKLLQKIDPNGVLLQPFRQRELGIGNRYPIQGRSRGRFLTAFENFDRDYPESRKRLYIISVILTVMSEICDEFDIASKDAQYNHVDGIAQQMVRYINTRLFENITLDTISKEFFLCESQINRIFKKATGSTIGEYIRTKRLVAAREKILEGEAATTAYSSCGFRDYSSFYRAYRSLFGHSPSETVPPHLTTATDEVFNPHTVELKGKNDISRF